MMAQLTFDNPAENDSAAPVESNCTELPPEELHFGQRLRKLRLERNMSLAAVTAKLHFQPGWLEVLEDGDYSRLDRNEFFIGRDISQLCQLYNVPADELLDDFSHGYHLHHPQAGDSLGEINYSELSGRPQAARTAGRIITVLISLLLLLIAGAWIYTTCQRRQQQKESQVYDLPALLPVPGLKLETLPIPR